MMVRRSGSRQRLLDWARAPWWAAWLFVGAALPAHAQDAPASAPKDRDAEIKTFEDETRKEADDALPKLKAQARLRRLERQSEDRLEQSIETLKELIAAAPDDDPDKPDYYMNLADSYWEKAEGFFEKAYAESLEEALFQAEEAGNTAEAERLAAKQQALLDQQQQWRLKTVETYSIVTAKFPDTPKIDEVLYYQALHQTLVGDYQAGYDTYVSLVQRRPQSPYVPDALVNIGEYYFNQNDFDTALAFYEKVFKGYPESSVYGFALYKAGWCYFNMGDYDLSLQSFLDVVRYSDSDQASRLGNRMELKKEAQRDLVRAYSMTGNPEKAVSFFKTVAPEMYLDLAGSLADMYSSQDKFADANKLYRYLIKERSDTHYVLEYQRKIVNLAYRSQKKAEAVKEVQRMLALYERVGSKAPEKWLAAEKKEVERELLVIATTWHKEGQKPFNPDTLQQAANLYREYQRLFPDSRNAYDVAMNQAILLKDVQNHREAAEAFDRVVELDPQGKYAPEAAYFAMFSYYQQIEQLEGDIKAEDEDGLAPEPIPTLDANMARACERYIQVAGPRAESAADAHYAAGRIYYNYNHFDRAIPLLERVIEDYPDNPNAPAAAQLLLSSLNLTHDFKALEGWAIKLAGTPLATGELQNTLTRIRDQAEFNRCFEYEADKEFARAADCFTAYGDAYPNTELMDRALFNAAVNYSKAKKVERAIVAHGDLYNRRPDSPYAPRSLFAIAEIYRQLAIYSDASSYYEQFAANHKGHPLTEKALRFASIYRKALGEHDKALANYARYLSLFSDSENAAAVEFDAGAIHESREDWRAMESHYANFIKKYGSSRKPGHADLILGATLKRGVARWNARRTRDAVKDFEAVLTRYQSMDPAERGRLSTGIGYVAEAQFMLGERKLEEARDIKITSANLQKAFSRKLEVIGEARAIFVEVIKLQQPSWVIAGLNRVGMAYEELSTTIENAPPPRGLNEEQREVYREDVIQKADALKERAIEAYRECLQTARELQWYNDFAEQAAASLARLDYSFNFVKEYRERTGAYTINPMPASFIGTPAGVADAAGASGPSSGDPDGAGQGGDAPGSQR